ncbi:MAG TPA: DnaT-like ssDNA-binding protein [Candidatus Paceibacterota bacterium]
MALTVEDGTGVAGANSYVSLADARAYALARGATLPAVDASLEALLIRGMDYLESKRDIYTGTKTYTDKLQWPRTDAVIDDLDVAIDFIPEELKSAQCQLAIELQTYDPLGSTSGQIPKMEKVGDIEVQYAVNFLWDFPMPTRLPKVDILLAPLCKNWLNLTTIRI